MATPIGLSLKEEAISAELEQRLINEIDNYGNTYGWNTTLKRRTLHFGYTYDYRNSNVTPTTPIAGLFREALEWLIHYGWLPRAPEGIASPYQCIVNEYTQTQGITAHSDAPIFGDAIVSLSLSADTNMQFARQGYPVLDLFLPRRSVVRMSEESRYLWTHAIIPSRKTYMNAGGQRVPKSDNYRRLSLTFRYIKSSLLN